MMIKASHKGRLHRALHVAATQKIPVAKMVQAAHSKSPALRKEANFALNARHFKHK